MKRELLAFVIGYFLTFVLIQTIPVVMVYPRDNSITYLDDRAVCYAYRRVDVDCPQVLSHSEI